MSTKQELQIREFQKLLRKVEDRYSVLEQEAAALREELERTRNEADGYLEERSAMDAEIVALREYVRWSLTSTRPLTLARTPTYSDAAAEAVRRAMDEEPELRLRFTRPGVLPDEEER